MTTAWDGYGEARMPTTCEVYEDDPQPTGLLDRWGNPLIRQREPIGFRLTGHHPSGQPNPLISMSIDGKNGPSGAGFSTAPRNGKPLLSCPINEAATNDTQEDRE